MSSDRPGRESRASRAHPLCPLLPGLLLWAALLLPASALHAQETLGVERSLESGLLHQRVDLRQAKAYDATIGSWRPLPLPRAKVLVVNLWSRTCKPCMAEFPALRDLAEAWRPQRDVQFLFVADPTDETSEADVATFWRHPALEIPPQERCPGTRLPGTVKANCVIELPTRTPVHCGAKSLLRDPAARLRPLTLLLDPQGVIRHVFAGSMVKRQSELTAAIERLRSLRLPEPEAALSSRPIPAPLKRTP